MNRILKFVSGAVVALIGVMAFSPMAHATYTDPAADINTAVAAAGAGASTAYTSTLTVLASVVLVGLVIWGLRKGLRPR